MVLESGGIAVVLESGGVAVVFESFWHHYGFNSGDFAERRSAAFRSPVRDLISFGKNNLTVYH